MYKKIKSPIKLFSQFTCSSCRLQYCYFIHLQLKVIMITGKDNFQYFFIVSICHPREGVILSNSCKHWFKLTLTSKLFGKKFSPGCEQINNRLELGTKMKNKNCIPGKLNNQPLFGK